MKNLLAFKDRKHSEPLIKSTPLGDSPLFPADHYNPTPRGSGDWDDPLLLEPTEPWPRRSRGSADWGRQKTCCWPRKLLLLFGCLLVAGGALAGVFLLGPAMKHKHSEANTDPPGAGSRFSFRVKERPDLTAQFQRFSPQTNWTGGIGGASCDMEDGKNTFWVFASTLIGSGFEEGKRSVRGSIENSACVFDMDTLLPTFTYGIRASPSSKSTEGLPESSLWLARSDTGNPKPSEYLDPVSVIKGRTGAYLVTARTRSKDPKTPASNFTGTVLALYPAPGPYEPIKWLPSSDTIPSLNTTNGTSGLSQACDWTLAATLGDAKGNPLDKNCTGDVSYIYFLGACANAKGKSSLRLARIGEVALVANRWTNFETVTAMKTNGDPTWTKISLLAANATLPRPLEITEANVEATSLTYSKNLGVWYMLLLDEETGIVDLMTSERLDNFAWKRHNDVYQVPEESNNDYVKAFASKSHPEFNEGSGDLVFSYSSRSRNSSRPLSDYGTVPQLLSSFTPQFVQVNVY